MGGAGPNGAGMDVAVVEVLQLSITETVGGSVVSLPSTALDRPCYLADLRSATVPDGNSGALALNGGGRVVTWNGNGQSMTYANVHTNGGTKESWSAIGSFTTGSVYELSVTGANAHPLHMHVQPFQIISMGGADTLSDGYFQAGDWHDTLYLEDLGGGGNALTVRMNTDVFTGRMEMRTGMHIRRCEEMREHRRRLGQDPGPPCPKHKGDFLQRGRMQTEEQTAQLSKVQTDFKKLFANFRSFPKAKNFNI